ncbi:MAG: hypothetical protein ACRDGI_07330 [Candidatus Limnocylindrales bacterium]
MSSRTGYSQRFAAPPSLPDDLAFETRCRLLTAHDANELFAEVAQALVCRQELKANLVSSLGSGRPDVGQKDPEPDLIDITDRRDGDTDHCVELAIAVGGVFGPQLQVFGMEGYSISFAANSETTVAVKWTEVRPLNPLARASTMSSPVRSVSASSRLVRGCRSSGRVARFVRASPMW